jgi:NAD(P)-dependent dehydrogenase (short-subunit alcohol dehydrogenase family)
MGRLDGRVAIVTGAGRGLGRAHALYLASQGANVVVNDLGGGVHGGGADRTPAQQVVDEIRAGGGHAEASGHDVASWSGAGEMVRTAVDAFGDLHVLVNNAGIVRDRTLTNMTEAEWDDVIRVHLKGHAAPTHHAMTYWRDQAKAGRKVQASVIHTSSLSGLCGNFGQANYATAKLGVVALSTVAALEGVKSGVRSNAVSPSGRTRLAATVPGGDDMYKPPEDPSAFDALDPANVSPLIGWLAEADCPANSQIFHIGGDTILVMSLPPIVHKLKTTGRWTPEALDDALENRLVPPISWQDYV